MNWYKTIKLADQLLHYKDTGHDWLDIGHDSWHDTDVTRTNPKPLDDALWIFMNGKFIVQRLKDWIDEGRYVSSFTHGQVWPQYNLDPYVKGRYDATKNLVSLYAKNMRVPDIILRNIYKTFGNVKIVQF